MAADRSRTTHATLLAKLRDPNNREVWDDAWRRFFNQYSPVMLAWCRRSGLQDSDAEEVTANVLFKLGQRMQSFDYDPSRRFHNWLRTVVHHEVLDFFSTVANRPFGGEALDVVPDDGDAEALCQEIEARRHLLEQALAEVRPRVEPRTWAAFSGRVLEDRGAEEVAAECGLTKVAVYQAKTRVLKMIRQVVDRLRGDTPLPD